MSELRSAVKEFREAVHREGARGPGPSLQAILERRRPNAPVLQWRWAVAAMVIVGLGAIPVYRNVQEQRELAADAALLQQVDAALARTAPRAFSVLVGN